MLQDRCFSGDRSRITDYRGKTWSLYLLGHLKDNLIESLSDRYIGIDPFVYPLPPSPDTILFFGRSQLPAYLEINNNGLLNLKAYLKDLTADEEKSGRIRKIQDYYMKLLSDHDPKLKKRRLPPRAKSKTVMSFEVGLINRNGELIHSSTEAGTIVELSRILETFYGSPPCEQRRFAPSDLPPNF